MTTSLKLLSEPLGVSPDTKFFLLRFLQVYQRAQAVTLSSKELVKSFGGHDKGIKKVLDELCEKKYLTRLKKLTGSRGRPKQTFAFGEMLAGLIDKWSENSAPISNQLIIERLLVVTSVRTEVIRLSSSSSLGSEKKKSKSLRLFTDTRKLLLCILWSKADQFGVVRNLGMSELALLVGLTKAQLRWHLRILSGSQYLIDYFPGRAFRGVKGRLKSLFILEWGWIEPGVPAGPIPIIRDSDALRLFDDAVRFTYAVGINKACKSQVIKRATLSRVNEVEYKRILGAARLLRAIADPNRGSFRRLCAFACELVEVLLTQRGLTNPSGENEEGLVQLVIEESRKRKLDIVESQLRGEQDQGLQFFSSIILKLYDEVLTLIEFSNIDPQKIKSCVVFPEKHPSILVHCFVDSE